MAALPFLAVRPLDVILSLDDSPLRDQGPLWHVEYDGSDPERIARRATSAWIRIADGRVATPVDVRSDYLGDLVVVEPESLDEQRIDDHVFAFLPTKHHDAIFDDDALAYAVRDGDRSGVWLARVAPQD